ncbi:hypothetical protein HNY73_002860 [Argiope bruennichi]|uniref:Uncharacterized protein n=1 Tax=Argiope bruennichi TaxID=94029 RepID=A0A8T0FW89_ARGBR|nr:hypothetical protein HNY73_002860 [Argiope bruennichi]
MMPSYNTFYKIHYNSGFGGRGAGRSRFLKGRRQISPNPCFSGGVFFYGREGECEPLGQKGQKCSENLDARGERYVYHCPCAAGLACELETKNTWFGTVKVNPKCVEDIAHTTPAQTDRTEQPETTLVERETTNVDRETTDVDRETTIVLESTVETQVPDEV